MSDNPYAAPQSSPLAHGEPDAYEPEFAAGDPLRTIDITPRAVARGRPTVYAWYTARTVASQFAGSAVLSGIALFAAGLFAVGLQPLLGIPASVAILALYGWILYYANGNDYQWLELSDDVLRARHLYTRRVTAWPIATVESVGLEPRHALIRMRNAHGTLVTVVAAPVMKEIGLLIQSIIARKFARGQSDVEVVRYPGVARIHTIRWKDTPAAG